MEDARDHDDLAGDGFLMKRYGEKFIVLTECRNDREFGMIGLACGISRLEGGKGFDLHDLYDEDYYSIEVKQESDLYGLFTFTLIR